MSNETNPGAKPPPPPYVTPTRLSRPGGTNPMIIRIKVEAMPAGESVNAANPSASTVNVGSVESSGTQWRTATMDLATVNALNTDGVADFDLGEAGSIIGENTETAIFDISLQIALTNGTFAPATASLSVDQWALIPTP